MKQVSICIITNNNFLRTKYFVQNLLFKTSHKYKLHILDNNSSSIELKKYINEVTIDTGGVFINSQEDLSISECYNKLLNTVENNFCVFVPITALVTKNWAKNLKGASCLPSKIILHTPLSLKSTILQNLSKNAKK